MAFTRDDALALDAQDGLAHYKSQFLVTDPSMCYLDGNSLGRIPKATIERINAFMVDEWGAKVVDGWADWIDEAADTDSMKFGLDMAINKTQIVPNTTNIDNLPWNK